MAANSAEQSKQRRYDLKSEVYYAAVRALATGPGAIVRMSNLEIRAQDVLCIYNDKMNDLFGVHLVADMETASKFLDCVQQLGAMHVLLMKDRPFRPDGNYQRQEIINWTRRCSRASKDVLSSMTLAVAAMRSELDLHTDVDEYENLIRSTLEKMLTGNEQLYDELLAREIRTEGRQHR